MCFYVFLHDLSALFCLRVYAFILIRLLILVFSPFSSVPRPYKTATSFGYVLLLCLVR